jgi:predicted GH43/DUF377 family glycosyl hydrolase
MWVFFRYDVENISEGSGYKKNKSFIAGASWDLKTNRLIELKELGLTTYQAEDPRALFFQGQIYLFFNRPTSNGFNSKNGKSRRMAVAKICPESIAVLDQKIIDFNLQPIEKNWTPFIGLDEKKQESIFMIHSIPKKLLLKLDLMDLSNCSLEYQQDKIPEQIREWEKNWGKIRGGTPAVLSEGEYWLFFHSEYIPKLKGMEMHNYVMGALVLEKEFPFHPKRISKEPIVFNGMYTSSFRRSNIFTVYPAGVHYDDKKRVFNVSIGENDRGMKVLTLDKEALEKGMLDIY